MKQIVPTTRVNSHFVPEDGYLTCEEPGTCKSYVYTPRSKVIFHMDGYFFILLCNFQTQIEDEMFFQSKAFPPRNRPRKNL